MSTVILWATIVPIFLSIEHGSFFESIVLYFVIPSVYMSFRWPSAVPRALVAASCTIPIVTIFDGVALLNGAWTVTSIFSNRFLSLIPIEDYAFTFFACFAVVLGLQHELIGKENRSIRLVRSGWFAAIACTVALAASLVYAAAPSLIRFRYSYVLIVMSVFVAPVVWLLYERPAHIHALTRMVPFAFIAMLLYEITALHSGWWAFPSQDYVFLIQFVGAKFPLEELVAWMVLFVPSVWAFAEMIT